jgi:hypothetical protein
MEVITISNQSDFTNLYKFIQNKKLQGKRIQIDLSDLETEITPSGVILIVMFVIFHKNLECSLSLIEPNDLSIRNYLRDIKIREFCQRNYQQSQELEAIDSVSAFPIWRVEKQYLNEYIIKVSAYFNLIDPTKDFTIFEQAIAELVNNVYDHSQSDLGAYIFIQYYPDRKLIETTVADLGVGIPFSINNYYRKSGIRALNDQECLLLSLKPNFTTQSIPQNKGKGLDNVRSFILANQGTLLIYSETGFYKIKKENQEEVCDNPINYFKSLIY